MPQYHDTAEFLALRDAGLPLLDARSPSEFANAHIAAARNLPVLDDEERAAVGTAHARSGPEGAVHLALTLVGPQLAARLARARRLFQEHLEEMSDSTPASTSNGPDGSASSRSRQASNEPGGVEKVSADSLRKSREVLIHCWRGGMRSSSLAWLLETGGFTVHVLRGGYRAYRSFVRAELSRPPASGVLVLGGMTGSGKTDMLHELAKLGAQVIDLEGMAGHRGSAFGGVGLGDQPSNEAMENALHERWRTLKPDRPVWLEDEDRRIGSVSLCGEFFEHILQGRLALAEIPFAVRVERLTRMYTGPEYSAALMACVERLRRRLGDEAATACISNIGEGRFRDAVEAVLHYYDALYLRQMDKHARPLAGRITLENDDPAAAAHLLVALERFA